MNRIKTLCKLYGSHEISGLRDIYIEINQQKHLWYDVLIDNPLDILSIANKGYDPWGRKILKMGTILKDKEGFEALVDFTPEELINIFGNTN